MGRTTISSNNKATIRFIAHNGRVVAKQDIIEGETEISTANWASCIYIIEIISNQNITYHKLIIL